MRKLKTVLLLDDNSATNFIHKKFIGIANCAENVIDFKDGDSVLEFLKTENIDIPELMFLDINMPVMNAWEFLQEYEKLELDNAHKMKIILLSTSLSPKDREKAEQIDIVDGLRLKPLTVKTVIDVMHDFFP